MADNQNLVRDFSTMAIDWPGVPAPDIPEPLPADLAKEISPGSGKAQPAETEPSDKLIQQHLKAAEDKFRESETLAHRIENQELWAHLPNLTMDWSLRGRWVVRAVEMDGYPNPMARGPHLRRKLGNKTTIALDNSLASRPQTPGKRRMVSLYTTPPSTPPKPKKQKMSPSGFNSTPIPLQLS
ncbi:hypothetical protein FVEN_g7804 [Fusarium venenatum]|uniref:Uncharacterized protein n=1 Tax=Fusarium venenatum TaxID=56646 RepID=A0A2L2TCV7_9HYPO|nr:uncharacterized protein FVRRES_07995 [Fusarium venenatum]KAG8354370.1 hypothetical protein FVEN_g7804 [Fusarium venenatum]CEI67918.1 unnamed protein product [Fusarium venenatum]